mgnify:CR=1 FL=1|jgi:hypothetical protein
MDFLDQQFASVNRAVYSEFLGIGSKNTKITGQNEAEQSILERYPFSSDCETQKELIKNMMTESADILSRRNSAKKGKSRDNMTGWLRAFDAYIPAAVEFMNTVSCAVPAQPAGTVAPATTTAAGVSADPLLNTAVVPGSQNTLDTAGNAAQGLLKTPMSKNMKYALIGLGVVIAGVVIISIVKKSKAA